jgi:stress response protein SCP2
VVGVSWDRLEGRTDEVDLDASCVAFDREGQFHSSIYFGNLTNDNKSITHRLVVTAYIYCTITIPYLTGLPHQPT